MFILLVFVLLVFTDHSQGVPETHEESLIVNTFVDASDVGEPLATVLPVNTPRQHKRLCNCKGETINKGHPGKVREMVITRCLCQQSARGNGRHRKLKMFCQKSKNKNLKKCLRFSKQRTAGNTRKFAPSVPI